MILPQSYAVVPPVTVEAELLVHEVHTVNPVFAAYFDMTHAAHAV
jgi:hypothetical protein